MYGSSCVGLSSPAPAALPGASTRSTVPSDRVTTLLDHTAFDRIASTTAFRPFATTSPVRLVAPDAPVTVTACGTANMSTCELLSHRPPSLYVNSLQSNRMSRLGSPPAHGAGCTSPSGVSEKGIRCPNEK